MYVTRRENGYRFQRRIPKDLEPILGESPLRLHLGQLPARKAAFIGRLLVSHSDRLFHGLVQNGCRFMPDNIDPRDAIIAELQRQLAEVMDDARKTMEATEQAIQLQESVHAAELEQQANEIRVAALERENTIRRDVNAVYTSFLETQATVLQTLEKAKAERNVAAVTPKLEALSEKIESLNAAVETSLDGGYVRPLMSAALDQWHREIRVNQGIKEKKTDTDYNRLKDFIAFAGDKPVNKYRFFDFQRFANLLAIVPSNYNKIPALRGKTREEAAAYNANLPSEHRLETLSITTIETNYFSPLQVFFQDIAAEYEFRSPLVDVKIRIPKFVKGKTVRRPFTIEELNQWFPVAAKEKRAEMKWMPLLGAILGARVGELVPLQGKDIYLVEGNMWVIDLTTDLTDEHGDAEERQVKTANSRRIIALPDIIVRTGFIDYVKTRRPEDSLFPACFYHGKEQVKDPAGAASKRLNSQLKKVGIHRVIETTFHSTRHTAKDIMRLAKIDERIHDKQTGHANKTVSRNYGAKTLLREEIEVLKLLPLPEGLDLSPYFVR
ncbi:tyrosine-type recombinase/integrase [Shinella zoogloeoides]|uniref:tyrosine-type recombinase/integrase n=1 Tax=Shinella zoogloeoides TaxID=352475 RepID=UPI0028A91147|nr:tyrosine-type recombinase/integrase [Shinella zoogloeoides]